LTYAPSERAHDIGSVLVQSFSVPNPCDKDSIEKWEGCKESGRTHPAKALFALLMLAYSVEAQGRGIDEEETLFIVLPEIGVTYYTLRLLLKP
jgi:hypothetical protein